jgi:hypothetical protein
VRRQAKGKQDRERVYLNRPNSGSTIGGLHTLSDYSPDKLNASVHVETVESSGIPVVVSSAGEAELS